MTYNQFLTEQVLKECWHEYNKFQYIDYRSSWDFKCKKCGISVFEQYIHQTVRDFSTPADWWYLWEFCKKQEWWKSFWLYRCDAEEYLNPYRILNTIDLKTFPVAVAKYHGWEGE